MKVLQEGAPSLALESDPDLVVVVGAGLAGLATALRAARDGRPVVVLEASARIGGAAAYSGGQVWVGANHVAAGLGASDDLALVETYVRAISAEHPEVRDDRAMVEWIQAAPRAARYWESIGAIEWEVIPGLSDYHADAAGATAGGRYLTSRPVAASTLDEHRELLRNSPYFPVGMSYAEMLGRGRRKSLLERPARAADTPAFGAPELQAGETPLPEMLTFGPGVVASFLRRLMDEEHVVIRLGARIDALVTDAQGGVVGAGAGESQWLGPVVLATSTFDWNPSLVEEIHGLPAADFGSVAPKELCGDAITLARSVGGTVAKIPASSVPMKPGWEASNETGFAYGAEYAMPHCMIVDQTGRRFCDDSYWVDIIAKVAAPGSPHLPFFMIWDERHHQKYGLGAVDPGGLYSDAVYSAPTLSALAQLLGVPPDALEATAAAFSDATLTGIDTEFGRGQVPYVRAFVGDPEHRPNPVLGPIDTPPFFGMRLKLVSTGIGSSGVRVDAHARVVDAAGVPIPGLFAAGSCTAALSSGSGYNSGFALSRALTHAYQIGEHLKG